MELRSSRRFKGRPALVPGTDDYYRSRSEPHTADGPEFETSVTKGAFPLIMLEPTVGHDALKIMDLRIAGTGGKSIPVSVDTDGVLCRTRNDEKNEKRKQTEKSAHHISS